MTSASAVFPSSSQPLRRSMSTSSPRLSEPNAPPPSGQSCRTTIPSRRVARVPDQIRFPVTFPSPACAEVKTPKSVSPETVSSKWSRAGAGSWISMS